VIKNPIDFGKSSAKILDTQVARNGRRSNKVTEDRAPSLARGFCSTFLPEKVTFLCSGKQKKPKASKIS